MGMRVLAERRDWWVWVDERARRRRLNEIARLVVPEEGEEEEVLVDVEDGVEGEGEEGQGGENVECAECVDVMIEMEDGDGDSSEDYVDG